MPITVEKKEIPNVQTDYVSPRKTEDILEAILREVQEIKATLLLMAKSQNPPEPEKKKSRVLRSS
jgi:hypothetical protein